MLFRSYCLRSLGNLRSLQLGSHRLCNIQNAQKQRLRGRTGEIVVGLVSQIKKRKHKHSITQLSQLSQFSRKIEIVTYVNQSLSHICKLISHVTIKPSQGIKTKRSKKINKDKPCIESGNFANYPLIDGPF